MNRIDRFVMAAALTVLATPAFAGIPLDVAVKTGKVDVRITGRGVASGDAINVQVKKKVAGNVEIDIAPGTVFRAQSGKVQSMVFRRVRFEKVTGGYKRASTIVLSDNNTHHFVLEAYCRDHGKPMPRSRDQFVIESPQQVEVAILTRGTDVRVTNKVMQVAIWIERSGQDPAKLRNKFKVTADEYQVATRLVTSARQQPKVQPRPETGKAVAAGTNVAVDVELRNLMDGILKRIESRQPAPGMRRGDRVQVDKSQASLTATRFGRLVVAELNQGDEVQVVRVVGQHVLCVVTTDGKERRGWLARADLGQSAAGDARPVGGLLRESALEVLDKIDIDVSTPTTDVSVGNARDT